jgi:hypothetical protein
MKYNLDQTFMDLSINEDSLSEEHKINLQKKGYTVIKISTDEWSKRGVDLELISKVTDELIKKEGWRGGWDHIKDQMKYGQHPEPGAQRLNNLLNKHSCYRNIFVIPEVLSAAKLLIKDEFCLSQLILRMPFPGKGDQPWHIDWMPKKKKSDPIRSVLASLLLDDFTKENGATRVVPGSHIFLKTPYEEGYTYQDHPSQKYIEASKGSLLIYDINLWHRGSTNMNGKKRRHLNINYRDRKIWQQINFKKDLSEKLKNEMSEAELYLLKARKIDPNRNDWLFKHRNNILIKNLLNLYWNLR